MNLLKNNFLNPSVFFTPRGRPDLFCFDGFAVYKYSFTRRALHIGP